MRIYNKKVFVSGIFMVFLGILNLFADIVNKTVDINGMILVSVLLLFGISAIIRSLSRRMAKEDRLEELDERNRLIELKSKSKSFSLTQILTFLFMLALMVMGKVSGNKSFIAMGTGMAFTFAISMFSELFTYLYYEQKN